MILIDKGEFLKILWILLIGIFSYASEYDYIKIYRDGGIEALEKEIDKVLESKVYWDSILESMDTQYGYYENLEYLFVASKKAKSLQLFMIKNHKLEEKLNAPALIGSKLGHKQKEGDRATPIGVYELNSRLVNLDQYYGPLALTTSYPNLLDKLNERTGYGIWIHGMPLNGNREEQNTRGCIAIENELLKQVDKMVDHKKALLITYENEVVETKKSDLGILLSDLFVWKRAWSDSDIATYLGFYDENEFLRFDKMGFQNFKANKTRIFAKKEQKTIKFNNINISPYPNDSNKNMFKISFFEEYRAPSYRFNGDKELFVELKNGKMRIIAEK